MAVVKTQVARRPARGRGNSSQTGRHRQAQRDSARHKWRKAGRFLDLTRTEVGTNAGPPPSGLISASPVGQLDESGYSLALSDAVSGMKELLQGYICYSSGQYCNDKPEMDGLLQRAEGLGLRLGDDLKAQIVHANKLRNRRIHRDPWVRVTGSEARMALLTAQNLLALIAATYPLADQVAQAAASGPASPDAAGPDEEDDGSDEEGATARTPRRGMRLLRVAAVAILALICLTSGAGLAFAFTSVPFDRLPFVIPSATATALPTATPTLAPTSVPTPATVVAGSLVASAPICRAGHAAVQLRNTGASPLQFSVGSPDAPSATFALAPDAPGQPTVSGSIPPGTEITLSVVTAPAAATYHIDVLAPGGTVQLTASAC